MAPVLLSDFPSGMSCHPGIVSTAHLVLTGLLREMDLSFGSLGLMFLEHISSPPPLPPCGRVEFTPRRPSVDRSLAQGCLSPAWSRHEALLEQLRPLPAPHMVPALWDHCNDKAREMMLFDVIFIGSDLETMLAGLELD